MKKTYIPRSLSREAIRDLSALGTTPILVLLSFISLWDLKLVLLIWILLMGLELLVSAIKIALFKDRPKSKNFSTLLEKIDASAFPSAHVARSTFVTTSLYFISGNPYPFIYLLIPLFVAYSRIALEKHYLIDIAIGYLLGIGWYFILSGNLL